MAFTLEMFPVIHMAKYDGSKWDAEFIEKEPMTQKEEMLLSPEERRKVLKQRNSFPELPLVNYTSQYGLGCFEGLKAFPQKNGGLKIFRPNENTMRMARSMDGLMMPPIDSDLLTKAILEGCKKNQALGYTVEYNPEWEKDNFINGSAIYIRPFSYSEAGIGVNLSLFPWVITVATPVSGYFNPDVKNDAVTSKMTRATTNGTGWIKCESNYVISALAKKKAEKAGYMEAIFLDAIEHKYIEEGTSCNFFAYFKNGKVVTPELGDTILPGITRKSVIHLIKEKGIEVEERKLSIDEVLAEAQECFVTGTAAGVTFLGSITHNDTKIVFNDGNIGSLAEDLLVTLKSIQYGAIEDPYNWMYEV